jgi:hypothetical protein
MRYFSIPQFQVTIGTEVFNNRKVTDFEVTRLENGWDTASITMDNSPNLYPSPAAPDAVAKIEVKDASDSAWVTIFNGVVRFPTYSSGDSKVLLLKCLGSGYPLGIMNVVEEYGTQSRNPTLDTFKEILTDSSYGIIPKHVNEVLGFVNNPDLHEDSGYNILTTSGGSDTVEAISGSIP